MAATRSKAKKTASPSDPSATGIPDDGPEAVPNIRAGSTSSSDGDGGHEYDDHGDESEDDDNQDRAAPSHSLSENSRKRRAISIASSNSQSPPLKKSKLNLQLEQEIKKKRAILADLNEELGDYRGLMVTYIELQDDYLEALDFATEQMNATNHCREEIRSIWYGQRIIAKGIGTFRGVLTMLYSWVP
ncbi:hypothetical protein PG994_002440 [Apiospora phragmitis]|uniref:Uncharacterized protein n=1 Tax=Apiospora phragmitis TaxID=2905665 RepID=A0ABR1WWE9_9PEZI